MKKMMMLLAAVAAVAGSVVAAGLGPQSYSQNGLVTQFDAIDNEGTGTHNPSAATWLDLKGSAYIALQPTAGWAGRYFDSSTSKNTISNMPAYYRNSISAETAINIIAKGRNAGATSSQYPRIFANGDNFTIHFGDSGTYAQFYMNEHNKRPGTEFTVGTISAYSGSERYALAVDGVQVDTSTYPVTNNVAKSATNWSLNGQSGYLHGHYYSFRLYNRMLSAGEIVTNAIIDKLRFWSYTYTGTGAAENWSDIAWTLPEGATLAAPSTRTNAYAQLVDATASVAAADKVGLLGLSLEDGAKLDIASDAAVGVKVLYVEGAAVPRGIYTGTGSVGTQVGWLSGAGVLRVAGTLDDVIPDIVPTPAADGWYEFGITSANGGNTWRDGNWYILADWPMWGRFAFPATGNLKARFVGYVILDTIPAGLFAQTDFSHAQHILLHGTTVFSDNSKFTLPAGVEMRCQPGTWTPQSAANTYKLTSTPSSGTFTMPLELLGTLRVFGDGTQMAYQTYSGHVTGTGTLKMGSYSKQARFSGGVAFNGTVTGFENGQLVWFNTLAVTSSIKGVTFSSCGETYHTNSGHSANGIFFGKDNSATTADHELYIASVYGNARDITDTKGKRWRCGGVLGVWGGNTIHVGKVTYSVHVVGRPPDIGCSNGWLNNAVGKGIGNLVVDESSTSGSFFLSTNVNVTVGKVTAATTFNYTYHANAINRTTLDITNSCLSTAKVQATDIGMLPMRLSGFPGTVTLTDTATKSYTMPIDFTHGTNYLYNTVGCIGSGTLESAPASGTIDVTFPTTGDKPVKGQYALARFTSGGDKLSGWTVTLNGVNTSSTVVRGMLISVVKDATGLWLDVSKPGMAIIFR